MLCVRVPWECSARNRKRERSGMRWIGSERTAASRLRMQPMPRGFETSSGSVRASVVKPWRVHTPVTSSWVKAAHALAASHASAHFVARPCTLNAKQLLRDAASCYTMNTKWLYL